MRHSDQYVPLVEFVVDYELQFDLARVVVLDDALHQFFRFKIKPPM
jgi:hypothetical protein